MKNPRNILITGASSGIGEALAYRYAAPGVTLHFSGRDMARLDAVAGACRAKGAVVHPVRLDVTDRAAMQRWIAEADAQTTLDLIIANAGVSGGTAGRIFGEPLDEARHIFDVNLMGVLNTIEPILPVMMDRGRGQIAIISSLAGFRGMPGAPAYSASKGAVRFYGEALRGAVRRTGVAVNVICPGFVESRMTAANDFPMPLLMNADKAALIIHRGLARNRGRIAFPLPTHCMSWLMSILPDALMQRILAKLPSKQKAE